MSAPTAAETLRQIRRVINTVEMPSETDDEIGAILDEYEGAPYPEAHDATMPASWAPFKDASGTTYEHLHATTTCPKREPRGMSHVWTISASHKPGDRFVAHVALVCRECGHGEVAHLLRCNCGDEGDEE